MVRLVRLIRIIKAFRSSKRISDLSILGSSSLAKTCIGFVPKNAKSVNQYSKESKNKVHPSNTKFIIRPEANEIIQGGKDCSKNEESTSKKKKFIRPGTDSKSKLIPGFTSRITSNKHYRLSAVSKSKDHNNIRRANRTSLNTGADKKVSSK
jgi:hypothetical protein